MTFEERDWFVGRPGTKENFNIRLGEMPNGEPYLLPVMVVTGVEDGPTFFLNAGMHGDEVIGSDVVRRTVNGIDPKLLRGRVLAVPFGNYSGVATRTRRNIVEMYPGPFDMNRVFPGDAHGLLTERLAAILTDRFITAADYMFDIHSPAVGGLWDPYASIPSLEDCPTTESYEKTVALGRAFGTSYLAIHSIGGTITQVARDRGVITGMAEFGTANTIDDPSRQVGLRGLSNVLKHAGMIPGEPEVPAHQDLMSELRKLKTDRGGFLVLHVSVGDTVAKGDLLAEVENLEGEIRQQFHAPVGGRVCRVNTMGVVGTGDFVVYIGAPLDAA
jgi:uncharacterized protein